MLDMPTIGDRLEGTRLVGQAMSLQLSSDNGPLSEVEALLLRALELWPDNLDALEEAAHFYDAVMDNDQEAVHYARCCRTRAAALVVKMDEVLADRGATC